MSLCFNFLAKNIFKTSTTIYDINTVLINNTTPSFDVVIDFAKIIAAIHPPSTPIFMKLSKKPFKKSSKYVFIIFFQKIIS